MEQITGPLFGTSGNDEFIGQFAAESIISNTEGAGIVNAVVATFGGSDRVVAEAILTPDAGNLSVTGIGIDRSYIGTGSGNDVVSATGVGERFLEDIGIRGPEFSGTGIGIGLRNSLISTGSGDDTLTFAGDIVGDDSFTRAISSSTGVSNSRVFAGTGNDQVTIAAQDIGLINAVVEGESGQDDISVEVASRDSAVKGAVTSRVVGGRDDDRLSISAAGINDAIAADAARVFGGVGNDTIILDANARFPSGRDGFNASITATGAGNGTVVLGEAGRDRIEISASGDSSGVTVAAIDKSTVDSGNDNDSIVLEASGIGLGGQVIAANQSTIRAGNGDDTITLIAELAASSGRAASIADSQLFAGAGNDVIRAELSVTPQNASASAGFVRSRLHGGLGDDRFEFFSSDATDSGAVADFGIQDSILKGGDGEDLFNVGIGSGRLNGGAGSDTALVSYLDTDTMSVSAAGGGVRILGTQNANGNAEAWQQDIVGVESFVVGDIAYSQADFLSTFGA